MVRILGLDIGNGHVKAYDGQHAVILPSIAGPAVAISFRSRLEGQHPDDITIESKGRVWFAGELALRQSPAPIAPRGQVRDGEILRMLMVAALYRLGTPTGEHLRVITGLPIQWYLPPDKEAMQQALGGPQHCTVNGEQRVWWVDTVEVYPQPFGTIAYELLRNGGEGQIAAWRNGVVDVGDGTTGLALFDQLEYREPGSNSIAVGIGMARELIAREVASRYGLEMELASAEHALRVGRVVVAGEQQDIAEIRKRALATVVDAIGAQITRLWGNTKQLQRIVLTGGGTYLLGDTLEQRYPQARKVAHPQLANAVGFQLYGAM